MPRYFFHTEDGRIRRDAEALELDGIRDARTEALKTVGQMMELKPDEFWDDGCYRMTVTDDTGLILLIIDLSTAQSVVTGPAGPLGP